MKIELITPPHKVSEMFLDWADQCYDMADHHAALRNHEEVGRWEHAAVEVQKVGYNFIKETYKYVPRVASLPSPMVIIETDEGGRY
jgi:hypothetical protein